MGYLTPILFRNDSCHILDKDPQQVIEKIQDAMNSIEPKTIGISFYKKRKWYQFLKPKKQVSGADCNPIKSLGARHADSSSVIIFYGNTWIDLTRELYKKEIKNSEYLKTCIKIVKRDIKELEKRLKE